MIIYLVRHGYSIANQRQLVTGTPSDCLTDIGRQQAAELGGWLTGFDITPGRFVVSHWLRAQETATMIFPDAQWEVDTRLGETDAGKVADITVTEFLSGHPTFYADPGNAYPGGESHLDLNNRVLEWLGEQIDNPCRSIVAVTHSGPITCLLQYAQGLKMSSFPAFLPSHATLSVLRFTRKSGEWFGSLAGFSLGPLANIRSVVNEDNA